MYGGTRDPFTTVEDLQAWRVHSAAGCAVRTFHGGHFYLHENLDDFLPVLAADLLSSVRLAARPTPLGPATPSSSTGRTPWSA